MQCGPMPDWTPQVRIPSGGTHHTAPETATSDPQSLGPMVCKVDSQLAERFAWSNPRHVPSANPLKSDVMDAPDALSVPGTRSSSARMLPGWSTIESTLRLKAR
jgi:hypothetical protein